MDEQMRATTGRLAASTASAYWFAGDYFYFTVAPTGGMTSA